MNPWTGRLLPATQRHAFQELVRHKEDLTLLAESLSNIQSTVTIVHGEVDTLVPVGNVDFLLERLEVPSDTHLLPGESHFVVRTQYELIVSLLLDLVEGEE
jgi:pimeloyl-ACP methyl ester carboxylesterase